MISLLILSGLCQRSVLRIVLLAALCVHVTVAYNAEPYLPSVSAHVAPARCDIANHDVVVVLDATESQRNAACGRDSCRIRGLDLIVALSKDTIASTGQPKISLVLYGDNDEHDDHFRSQLALQTLNDDLLVQAVVRRPMESTSAGNLLQLAVEAASMTLLGGSPQRSKVLLIMSQYIVATNGSLSVALGQLSRDGIAVVAVTLAPSSEAAPSQTLADDVTLVNLSNDLAAEENAEKLLTILCNAAPPMLVNVVGANDDAALYAVDPFLRSQRGRREARDLQRIQGWSAEGHIAKRPGVQAERLKGHVTATHEIETGLKKNYITPTNRILPDPTVSYTAKKKTIRPMTRVAQKTLGPETLLPTSKANIPAGTPMVEKEGTVANEKKDRRQSVLHLAMAVGAAIGLVAVAGGLVYTSFYYSPAAPGASSAASTMEIA